MSQEPIQLALTEISQTKRLLETLIHCSETFDYVAAKAALLKLKAQVGHLGDVQLELAAQLPIPSDRLVPFPGGTSGARG